MAMKNWTKIPLRSGHRAWNVKDESERNLLQSGVEMKRWMGMDVLASTLDGRYTTERRHVQDPITAQVESAELAGIIHAVCVRIPVGREDHCVFLSWVTFTLIPCETDIRPNRIQIISRKSDYLK